MKATCVHKPGMTVPEEKNSPIVPRLAISWRSFPENHDSAIRRDLSHSHAQKITCSVSGPMELSPHQLIQPSMVIAFVKLKSVFPSMSWIMIAQVRELPLK